MPNKNTGRRLFPWVIAAVAGLGVLTLVACLGAGYFLLVRYKHIEPLHAKKEPVVEEKKQPIKADPPKNKTDLPKKDDEPPKKKEVKKPPEVEKKPAPRDERIDFFIEQLNRHRKSAGLDSVALDVELSRGCLAHAKYLAAHFDPDKDDAAVLAAEDAAKPGYSVEGQRAGLNAMIAFGEPAEVIEAWMGRLVGRVRLLSPDMKSVGIGFAKNGKGDWVCVLDPIRGRGEPIVIVPTPKQLDVPLSFTTGPEVPDAKSAAGYPITVTFPTARNVTNVSIELRDAKSNRIEHWLWTPEKPLPSGGQRNTIALIPKGLLRSSTVYQVSASALVDAKPWDRSWSFTTADDSDSKGIWTKKALDKVNAYRAHAGLGPVQLDENLSRGCLAHARYLAINEGHPALQGLKAHDEDLTLPGASEEGRTAGKASDIAIGDYEPIDGVDAWMATLYHRVPILEPGLKTIGFGCVRGRRQGWVAVLNVGSGRAKGPRLRSVFYPAPDQTGVALNFPNGGEEPNPIPEDKTGRAGFPITAFFPEPEPLKSPIGKLTNDRGIEVPCWFSSQDKRANPKVPQGNTVCLIPKEPLAPNTKYHVHLQGLLDGKAWDKKWTFTTGTAGPSVPEATRTVVDKFNLYRAQAGLKPVALDESLTRGCQLHAEYLAKNAEVIARTKASVNDEDVKLPGFTAEGLRAALQSDVFTNAPTPATQIDDLMATFTRRVYLLDPNLQRIGFGCFHDVGRGWRCVLNLNSGRGDARVVLYPVPMQDDVPTVSSERIESIQGNPGFPISITFPRQPIPRNVQVALSDAKDNAIPFQLNDKAPRGTIGVYPLEPLQAEMRYSISVSTVIDGIEWRRTWQFTTGKKN